MRQFEWLIRRIRQAFDSDYGEIRISLTGQVTVEVDDFSEQFDNTEDFENWVRSL